MREQWRDELDVAMEAAWVGGRVTLRWFQAAVEAERKADRSPVTAADRGAEAAMREVLERRFPDDGVLGEEAGEASGRSGRRWILDPIDGTRSFIHGVPLYGVMVALEADGVPAVGVLHFPALGETVAAALGLGCRWNGRPCRVSGTDDLERALVVTSGDARLRDPDGPDDALSPTSPGPADAATEEPGGGEAATGQSGGGTGGGVGLPGRVRALGRLAGRVDTFRTWGDCYGYALVATGRAEAMVDPVLNIWDAAAVRPVIEEAGGVFTDWTGLRSHDAGHAIGTNAALATDIRKLLR